MFENPRRGRQARNFGKNVPKILDLKSSSEQIFSENCRWVPLKFTGSWYSTCRSCKRYCKSQIYVKHYPNGNFKNIMVFFALANVELYKLTSTLPCPVLEIAAETRSWQPVWRSGKKERWREITIQGADHQAKWDVFDWERIQRFSEEKTVNTETILQEW